MRGLNDLLCLTRPDSVEDIHRRYLEAGADIISTNTFNANEISLEEYAAADLSDAINAAAVALAAGRPMHMPRPSVRAGWPGSWDRPDARPPYRRT